MRIFMSVQDPIKTERLKRLAQAYKDYQAEMGALKRRQQQILEEASELYKSAKIEQTRTRLKKLLK